MITISVCMIVKNEENILARCLESLVSIADEIIIVDTGSTDRTKQIAMKYTDKIYDFKWVNDFAIARDYSFSKATKEYIYVADADELLDDINIKRFLDLKKAMLPEIEIVQMKYTNQLENGSAYNYDVEYRGKLYKRIRTFRWVDPVHETVDVNPVIYDSDIEIIHLQEENHANRDFATFLKNIKNGKRLSKKLVELYARELYISGADKDFLDAKEYFEIVIIDETRTLDEVKIGQCVIARCGRILKEDYTFFTNALKGIADNPYSEICYELGEYYYQKGEWKEAIIWYYNAAYESETRLNIHCGGDYALKRLSECYEQINDNEQAKEFNKLALQWKDNINNFDH